MDELEVMFLTGKASRRHDNGNWKYGSAASILEEDLRRGGVEGNFDIAVLILSSVSSVVSDIFKGGVGLPELLVGESVDILSLSLSRSSATARVELWLLLRV